MTRDVVLQTRWCTLLAETLSDGEPYYMLDVPDYVAVVAMTAAGDVVLVRQHRPVVGRETIELPSGHVDPGESPEEAARRELLEETGMVAGDIQLLGVLSPDVGRLTNRMWCYFAPTVVPSSGSVEAEPGVTAVVVPERELLTMAFDGRLDHALNLAVVCLALGQGKLKAA